MRWQAAVRRDGVGMTRIAIVGAGPAGLYAAEVLADAGHAVAVYDAMPAPGRKLLVAGHGGLNLTHSEPLPGFARRYGPQAKRFAPWLAAFGPEQLRAWADHLQNSEIKGQRHLNDTTRDQFAKRQTKVAAAQQWDGMVRQQIQKLAPDHPLRVQWEQKHGPAGGDGEGRI